MAISDSHHHHRLLLDPGPVAGTGTKASHINESNFDTNMFVILAALICALICVLGLNSIVRCALSCGRRISAGENASRLGSTGLKKRALRRIPVTVYGSGESVVAATECPICLGEFVEGEKVRVLPKCNHEFHLSCIDTWLLSRSSCPTCRHSLAERPAPENDDVEAGNQSDEANSGGPATVVGVEEVSR